MRFGGTLEILARYTLHMQHRGRRSQCWRQL